MQIRKCQLAKYCIATGEIDTALVLSSNSPSSPSREEPSCMLGYILKWKMQLKCYFNKYAGCSNHNLSKQRYFTIKFGVVLKQVQMPNRCRIILVSLRKLNKAELSFCSTVKNCLSDRMVCATLRGLNIRSSLHSIWSYSASEYQ